MPLWANSPEEDWMILKYTKKISAECENGMEGRDKVERREEKPLGGEEQKGANHDKYKVKSFIGRRNDVHRVTWAAKNWVSLQKC